MYKYKKLQKMSNEKSLQQQQNTEQADNFAKKYYVFEKHREESFKFWPFDHKNPCNLKKMAEAGFYWCGTEATPDVAACFMCGKELDGWEPKDDPWSEHLAHAPRCKFAQQRKSEKNYKVSEFINLLATFTEDYLRKKNDQTLETLKTITEECRDSIERWYK